MNKNLLLICIAALFVIIGGCSKGTAGYNITLEERRNLLQEDYMGVDTYLIERYGFEDKDPLNPSPLDNPIRFNIEKEHNGGGAMEIDYVDCIDEFIKDNPQYNPYENGKDYYCTLDRTSFSYNAYYKGEEYYKGASAISACTCWRK